MKFVALEASQSSTIILNRRLDGSFLTCAISGIHTEFRVFLIQGAGQKVIGHVALIICGFGSAVKDIALYDRPENRAEILKEAWKFAVEESGNRHIGWSSTGKFAERKEVKEIKKLLEV
jgi:hypothetical protein